MFNYIAQVVRRCDSTSNNTKRSDLYEVIIPAVSNDQVVQAKVLGNSTLYTNYYPKDSVLVGQISTTGDFIILGLVQRADASERDYFWHRTLVTKVDQLEEKYKQDIEILRSNRVIKLSKTLLATDWEPYESIYSQSLQIPGVREYSHVTVVPTLASTEAVIQAEIYPYIKVEENKITIYVKNQPSENIEIIVEVLV